MLQKKYDKEWKFTVKEGETTSAKELFFANQRSCHEALESLLTTNQGEICGCERRSNPGRSMVAMAAGGAVHINISLRCFSFNKGKLREEQATYSESALDIGTRVKSLADMCETKRTSRLTAARETTQNLCTQWLNADFLAKYGLGEIAFDSKGELKVLNSSKWSYDRSKTSHEFVSKRLENSRPVEYKFLVEYDDAKNLKKVTRIVSRNPDARQLTWTDAVEFSTREGVCILSLITKDDKTTINVDECRAKFERYKFVPHDCASVSSIVEDEHFWRRKQDQAHKVEKAK